jgi:hypothetical protein
MTKSRKSFLAELPEPLLKAFVGLIPGVSTSYLNLADLFNLSQVDRRFNKLLSDIGKTFEIENLQAVAVPHPALIVELLIATTEINSPKSKKIFENCLNLVHGMNKDALQVVAVTHPHLLVELWFLTSEIKAVKSQAIYQKCAEILWEMDELTRIDIFTKALTNALLTEKFDFILTVLQRMFSANLNRIDDRLEMLGCEVLKTEEFRAAFTKFLQTNKLDKERLIFLEALGKISFEHIYKDNRPSWPLTGSSYSLYHFKNAVLSKDLVNARAYINEYLKTQIIFISQSATSISGFMNEFADIAVFLNSNIDINLKREVISQFSFVFNSVLEKLPWEAREFHAKQLLSVVVRDCHDPHILALVLEKFDKDFLKGKFDGMTLQQTAEVGGQPAGNIAMIRRFAGDRTAIVPCINEVDSKEMKESKQSIIDILTRDLLNDYIRHLPARSRTLLFEAKNAPFAANLERKLLSSSNLYDLFAAIRQYRNELDLTNSQRYLDEFHAFFEKNYRVARGRIDKLLAGDAHVFIKEIEDGYRSKQSKPGGPSAAAAAGS